MSKPWLAALPLSFVLLAGADATWKEKQVAEWSDDDAKQVLTDSPWAKTVNPTVERQASSSQQRPSRGGGMGRGGGIGIGGMGIPGMGGGGGRRGGMGGGGYPGGRRGGDNQESSRNSSEPPTLKVRWESALPVRAAELKERDNNAPTLDEQHYALAVYGLPQRMASGNRQDLAKQLKKQANLKREGKKDLKPSSVEVLQREDGPVVVYLFPRSKEITKQDKRLEFNGQIGRFKIAPSFFVEDMVYQGKLEL